MELMKIIDYTIFPFTFEHLENNRVLIVNIAGEFLVLEQSQFNSFFSGTLHADNIND